MIPVVLLTDACVYILVVALVYMGFHLKKHFKWQETVLVFSKSKYMIATIILIFFGFIGFLDTLHFKTSKNSMQVKSILDVLLSPRSDQFEKTYSAPFASHSFSKEAVVDDKGFIHLEYIPLEHVGKGQESKPFDILWRIITGLFFGLILSTVLYGIVHFKKNKMSNRAAWATITCLICLVSVLSRLVFEYHILGTNKVGEDVFYIALKSIRTGLVIGSLTTLMMLPFALVLGALAGYFRGIVDDIIQYSYTTLSSVPAVLLIAAAVVSIQLKMQQNPDLRLLVLCIILGLTNWTGLCRLLRGETLKLREAEFVEAAKVLGVKPLHIIRRHILPNLMHIVIITVVLDFSGLILAEAVLSYVGVGVDATTYSFGNMINAARLEMAREPIIWWSMLGAFFLMFSLIFSANVVSDGIQEVLNPRRN